MATLEYYDILLKPVITEKSMAGMGEKRYTFYVHPEANKTKSRKRSRRCLKAQRSEASTR